MHVAREYPDDQIQSYKQQTEGTTLHKLVFNSNRLRKFQGSLYNFFSVNYIVDLFNIYQYAPEIVAFHRHSCRGD